MNRLKSLLVMSALGASLLSGCIVETVPISDFAMNGQWTVNGVPADATSCSSAGIESVRVNVMYEGTSLDYAELTIPCSAGSFQTGQIFDFGNYETRWEALDKDGITVGDMGTPFTLVVTNQTSVTLAPIDFITTGVVRTTLNVSFDFVAPDGSTMADCATAGVTSLDVDLTSGGSSVSATTGLPCGDVLFEDLAAGSYELDILGYDAGGNAAWAGTCPAITVAAGTANVHSCLMVPYVPPTPSVAVTFTFDGMTCAAAGITLHTFQIEAAGTAVAGNPMQTAGTCMDTVLFDQNLVDGTTYDVVVDSEGPSGAKFMATCAVVAGPGATATCDAQP